MLEGNLLFVETNRIKGTSAKGKDYDFTNLIVSDGFQSVELGMSDHLVDAPVMSQLRKGEKIKLTVDYKRGRFLASEISLLSKGN